tara:strand:- start:2275 stop:2901 length:627 start_codon:yes stop_codon:yes gene_type:complete
MSKITNRKQKEIQSWTPDQYTKASIWLDNIIEKSVSRIETLEKNVELLTNNIVDKENLLIELREDLITQKKLLDDANAENTLLFTIKNNISVPSDSIIDTNHEKGTQTAKRIRTRSTNTSSTDIQVPKKKGRPRKQPQVLSKLDSTNKNENKVKNMDTESNVSNASTLSQKNTILTPVVSPTTRRKRIYERNISFSPDRLKKRITPSK